MAFLFISSNHQSSVAIDTNIAPPAATQILFEGADDLTTHTHTPSRPPPDPIRLMGFARELPQRGEGRAAPGHLPPGHLTHVQLATQIDTISILGLPRPRA